MSFHISKSKFVSACERCDKYIWLEAHMPEQKAPVSEFAETLFDNGHKVGELAKVHFGVDADVTVNRADGTPDLAQMLKETERHMKLGTKVLAEASFCYNGCFCSVDILIRNADGSYDMCEVKSSKRTELTKKDSLGVKERYLTDASYQRYVLENCGVPVGRVYVVVLAPDYVRGKSLDLDKYFAKVDVTAETAARQGVIARKLAALQAVVTNPSEPASVLGSKCNQCEYFGYCGRHIPSPSPFDVQGLDFSVKCQYYNDGVSFFDVPKKYLKLSAFAKRQIDYYNRPNDRYIDKVAVQAFLKGLTFPLYSLDFETYQATVPEYEGMSTGEAVPFQYSLHIMKKADGDYTEGSPDLEERHFLDISGADPRRAIAESLVENIPYGACVVAWHKSTEAGIIRKLAAMFPDLKDHLLSFSYEDPSDLFRKGAYYVAAMGKKYSIKSVAPALCPDDPGMNYSNLEGSVKNGTQAMTAIGKAKTMSAEDAEKLRKDLEDYCALDTWAVVKILKKLYEDAK